MKTLKIIVLGFLILTLGINEGISQLRGANKTPLGSKKLPRGVKLPAKKLPYFAMGNFTNLESLPVWRVQLRIHTANRDKAGTDSKVYVKMTNNNQRFWLLQGGDDRQRNEWEIYDVVLTDPIKGTTLIPTVRQITQLTLGINGNDIWEFDRVELLINNPKDRKSTNRGGSPYTIYSYNASQKIAKRDGYRQEFSLSNRTLRSHYKWKSSAKLANFPWVTSLGKTNIGFQREVLEEVLEGAIGNALGPGGELSDRKWGRKQGRTHVGIKHKSSFPDNVARLDVDIAPSRLVDVEVKFRVACDGTNIKAEVIGTNVRTNRVAKIFATTFMGSLQYGLNKLMDTAVRPIYLEADICLPPKFTDDHHLLFLVQK
ncbi:hypothetical protein [Flagellimonas sp.]|uniref:hypothetical protein n=1 Tax=Flagellimonas sp. TaxID=2058762 RepID=UPI003F4A67BF